MQDSTCRNCWLSLLYLGGKTDIGLWSTFKKSSEGLAFLYSLLEIRDNQMISGWLFFFFFFKFSEGLPVHIPVGVDELSLWNTVRSTQYIYGITSIYTDHIFLDQSIRMRGEKKKLWAAFSLFFFFNFSSLVLSSVLSLWQTETAGIQSGLNPRRYCLKPKSYPVKESISHYFSFLDEKITLSEEDLLGMSVRTELFSAQPTKQHHF